MSLLIRPQAEADVLELADRIGQDRPRTGLDFLDRALETFRLLERLPLLGSRPPVPELARMGLRMFVVERFRNYLILYRPRPDGVEILRVVDGRRDLPQLLRDEWDI